MNTAYLFYLFLNFSINYQRGKTSALLRLRETNTARANYVVTYFKVKMNRKKCMEYRTTSLKRYKDKDNSL